MNNVILCMKSIITIIIGIYIGYFISNQCLFEPCIVDI